MRRVLALMLLPGAAFAQPSPQPPARVCVPAALLERLVSNVTRQPWADVSALMDDARQAGRGIVPCGDLAPDAPRPGPQSMPAPALPVTPQP